MWVYVELFSRQVLLGGCIVCLVVDIIQPGESSGRGRPLRAVATGESGSAQCRGRKVEAATTGTTHGSDTYCTGEQLTFGSFATAAHDQLLPHTADQKKHNTRHKQ